MKRTINSTLAFLLALISIFCLVGCKGEAPAGLWENAAYTSDAEFGEGAKTVKVKVVVEDKSVTFTIKTDAETLGEALLAHKLIAGDQGDFGLYVKVVNGITADYDVDKSYWNFTKNGEYMMTGVDMTEISGGEVYELTYTK